MVSRAPHEVALNISLRVDQPRRLLPWTASLKDHPHPDVLSIQLWAVLFARVPLLTDLQIDFLQAVYVDGFPLLVCTLMLAAVWIQQTVPWLGKVNGAGPRGRVDPFG